MGMAQRDVSRKILQGVGVGGESKGTLISSLPLLFHLLIFSRSLTALLCTPLSECVEQANTKQVTASSIKNYLNDGELIQL